MPPETTTTTTNTAAATASDDVNTGFWKELDSWKTPIAKQVGPQVQVGAKAPSLADLSDKVPSVHCIAVSHSSEEATDRWLPQVGGTWNIDMVIDEERDLYANWGLGISSTWHAVNPFTMWNVFSLGKNEGIWNRPTESGSRWQTSGAFAVDRDGTVRWAQVARTADDLPDLKAAMTALGFPPPVDKRRPKHDH
ncbi:hypothetical protein NW752_004732 [Fusarium irregulare]|nr:hypothetical protein NW752_004732 [Fusarium irregulare]